MSDDIRAKAQAVLDSTGADYHLASNEYADDLARHVLATEARLDVALRGALQSREEMREWLGSEDVALAVRNVIASWGLPSALAGGVVRALIAAMPGGEA